MWINVDELYDLVVFWVDSIGKLSNYNVPIDNQD